jgi:Asp-tRNA(Asn)/Glu-tRNA(Gln) amidotransferase A subunit family amidase
VAAGMVPLALGTQTLGSVVRPAAFCGVAGFKPTYGIVPLDGVLPFAPSLDTLGFFTPTAEDMLALWEALGHNSQRPTPNSQDSQRPTSNSQTTGRSWELGIGSWELTFGVPEPLPDVEPSRAAALRETVAHLREAGATIHPLVLVPMLTELHAASRVVMANDAAIAHRERYEEHGAKLADMADLVREGRGVSRERYDEALRTIAVWRDQMAGIFRTTPIILVPAAVGPAPFSLASTGDPRMNSPWTALGTPAITIPMGEHEGLPLGLQLTAARGDDARLLQVAVHVEALLQRT